MFISYIFGVDFRIKNSYNNIGSLESLVLNGITLRKKYGVQLWENPTAGRLFAYYAMRVQFIFLQNFLLTNPGGRCYDSATVG